MLGLRIVIVGHYAYFSNHFPEGWLGDKSVLCLDVDETDYSFLILAMNFRPDITLFYRPELYPASYLKLIGGRRVAFMSEPVPELRDGRKLESPESLLRLRVYEGMKWDLFNSIYYYDESKAEMIRALGWPVNGYHPLPIDTRSFRNGRSNRAIDVCFIGKATPHRIAQLDFLRNIGLSFVWIAHGVSGAELASVFRRSKIVLNIHADGLPALEPRVWLAAACGCVVLTERLPPIPDVLRHHVVEFDGMLNKDQIMLGLRRFDSEALRTGKFDSSEFSCRAFLRKEMADLAGV